MRDRMKTFGVRPEKEDALRQRFACLRIFEKDIVEKFIRSRGKGGQKVNKVSTCVYLKHLPTGIEVKCQRERSQAINRFLARRILADKIEKKVIATETEEEKIIAKIRRQKRKRSKRAKLKILEAKRKHSEVKKSRAFRPKMDNFGD